MGVGAVIAVAVLTAVTVALLFLVKRSPRLDDHTRPGYPAEIRNGRKGDGT